MLHRCVDEFFYLCESDDLVELSRDLSLSHAEDRTVQENVFAACQFGMKTGADFKQTANATVEIYCARGGFGNPRKHFEQSGFSCPVSPNYADDFTSHNFERNVAKRPDCRGLRFSYFGL